MRPRTGVCPRPGVCPRRSKADNRPAPARRVGRVGRADDARGRQRAAPPRACRRGGDADAVGGRRRRSFRLPRRSVSARAWTRFWSIAGRTRCEAWRAGFPRRTDGRWTRSGGYTTRAAPTSPPTDRSFRRSRRRSIPRPVTHRAVASTWTRCLGEPAPSPRTSRVASLPARRPARGLPRARSCLWSRAARGSIRRPPTRGPPTDQPTRPTEAYVAVVRACAGHAWADPQALHECALDVAAGFAACVRKDAGGFDERAYVEGLERRFLRVAEVPEFPEPASRVKEDVADVPDVPGVPGEETKTKRRKSSAAAIMPPPPPRLPAVATASTTKARKRAAKKKRPARVDGF